MTDVDVSVEETPAQEPPSVVIVEQPESPAELNVMLDLTERMTRLESALEIIAAAVSQTADAAESAQAQAETATSIALEAESTALEAEAIAEEVAEIAVETADETGVLPEVMAEVDPSIVDADVSPKKTHPLFRSLSEWRNRVADV